MTYKQTLFFVARCLTIQQEEKNRILIENKLKSNTVDWDAVVKVSTSHYVFPALYCNLKRANLLEYVPDDLVEYMIHITNLNRERNEQIIEQAKEVNQLLLDHNITPVFLKGTGNLLEGLYEDIAERMVGDIDFIVAMDEYEETIKVLKTHDYKVIKNNKIESFHQHYPRIIKENSIAGVEIHNTILRKPYEKLLEFQKIKRTLVKQSDFYFLSNENKIVNTILPKIINDYLYHSRKIPLRTVYDAFLISKKGNYTIVLENKKILQKFNNFFGCIKMILNDPKSINVIENKSLKNYQRSYLELLANSRREKIIIYVEKFLFFHKERFFLLMLSLSDKRYREYVLKRVFELDLYRKIFAFRMMRKLFKS
jgi:hypothetical protein